MRKQPVRLQWPLTPSQVEALDEMLYELYKRGAVGAAASSAASAPSSSVVPGPPGLDGQDGEQGPPGRDGVNTTLESRVILAAETRIIADTYDRIYVDYLYIKGTLSIQGDGALAIL